MSFHTKYDLQRIVQKRHNIIWERQGHDPAQAFDEFSELLFLKLYDETENRRAPVSPIIPFESKDEYAYRIVSINLNFCACFVASSLNFMPLLQNDHCYYGIA